ncbi:MAG: NAAT family transporter [Chlorobi bacterium]|nr:NAAT family transporter [Chlorobiota bacterium]
MSNLEFSIIAFTSFFSLINPIATMPVFMSMTVDFDSQRRKMTAIKAIVISFLVLLLFAFTGQLLFKFFSISVESFRIVGGIIFFMMGYDMLQAKIIRTKMDEDEKIKYANDIAITPLAIPMICGPGAITNAIVMMEDASNFSQKALLISMLVFVLLLSLIIFLSANKIIKILGQTGNKILMRLMGLIVMVIAVEFFFSGLKPILIDVLQNIPK